MRRQTQLQDHRYDHTMHYRSPLRECGIGVLILCLLVAPGYAQDSEEKDIIGTWVSTEDSDVTLQFTASGLKQTYYDGEMRSEHRFAFVDKCQGGAALEQSPLDAVLQVTNSTEQDSCYHVMNLTDKRLTLAPFGRGGVSSYERVELGP